MSKITIILHCTSWTFDTEQKTSKNLLIFYYCVSFTFDTEQKIMSKISDILLL